MTTAEAVSYLQWKRDVAKHDYAAASSYLSIRLGESQAQEVSEKLKKLPVITRRANDILRGHRPRAAAAVGPGSVERPEEGAGRREAFSGSRSGGGYRGRLPPGLPRLRPRPLRGRATQARLGTCRAGRPGGRGGVLGP